MGINPIKKSPLAIDFSHPDWGSLLVDLCLGLSLQQPDVAINIIQLSGESMILNNYSLSNQLLSTLHQKDIESLQNSILLNKLIFHSSLGQDIITDETTTKLKELKLADLSAKAVIKLTNQHTNLYLIIYAARSLTELGWTEHQLQELKAAANNLINGDSAAIKWINSFVKPLRLPLAVLDSKKRVLYINKEHEALFGRPLSKLMGKPIASIRSNLHEKSFYESMWKKAESGFWSGSVWQVDNWKNYFYSGQIIIPIKDKQQNITHYAVLQQSRKKSDYGSNSGPEGKFDALTGLLSSQYFLQAATIKIETTREEKGDVALIIINVNNFTELNEIYGSEGGDIILKNVAKIIARKTRKTDLSGRLFGDEFALLIKCENAREKTERIVNDIANELKNNQKIGRKFASISASLGIAFFPEDGKDIKTLLSHASNALKFCKKSIISKHAYYQKSTHKESVKINELKDKLKDAIKRKLFVPFYQPIYDIKTLELKKVEVLARWPTDNDCFINPNDFIPTALLFNLMTDIGDIIFEKVISDIKETNEKSKGKIVFNVNKSIPEMENENLTKKLTDQLDKQNIQYDQLCIEVTEDVASNDFSFIKQSIREMQTKGFSIAIDDFGTGYSSLSYLIRNPVQSIKIDKSFIQSMQELSSLTLIKGIINIAHDLNISVVAEGIETEGQLRQLKELKCDYAQGFYLARPMPLKELLIRIEKSQG